MALGEPFDIHGVALAELQKSYTPMRTFETGSIRDQDADKLDFEAYLSPLVLERYARYMKKHQHLANGETRPGDNWQLGQPREVWIKSGWRHFFDWWCEHRGLPSREGLEDAICGVLFNAMGYLHTVLTDARAER